MNSLDFYTEEEREDIIKRTLDNDVWLINVGSDLESSRLAIKIAEQYKKGVYACVGLHPTDNIGEIFNIDEYRKLILNPKVVAIGECGIELHSDKLTDGDSITPLIKQGGIFKQQIELSLETDKPLMIHCRNAHEEVLEILEEYRNKKLKGNIHFFSGTPEQAHQYIDLGFTISFTGVITFTKDYDEAVKAVPLDKIMVETDAPFVTPAPHRGKRNEPLYVQEVAKKIAEIKEISYEEVIETTTKNAIKFFNLT